MSSPLIPVAAREGELMVPFNILPVASHEAQPEITGETLLHLTPLLLKRNVSFLL